MIDVRITGASQLGSLNKALKAAGDEGKGLNKELRRGIQKSMKPLRAHLKQSAKQRLPKSGGLAARVAGASYTTQISRARNPGVKLKVTGRAGAVSVRAMDRGRLRHPVFGNRGVWVTQKVPVGWFTKPVEADAPDIRRAVLEVIGQVTDKIGRST